jgi:hypothetical protein
MSPRDTIEVSFRFAINHAYRSLVPLSIHYPVTTNLIIMRLQELEERFPRAPAKKRMEYLWEANRLRREIAKARYRAS